MNCLTSFQLHKSQVRGRFVRLDTLATDILARHTYPPLINECLRELIPLAIALAGTFKFEGVFTLQIQGNQSPVRFMVVDVNTEGHVRACASFDEAKLKVLEGENISFPILFGCGYMAFTLDQGDHMERYQGIVELEGTTFAECLKHYFHQSEQLETSFFVAAREEKSTCMMIQKLPFDPEGDVEDFEGWFTANALLATLKKEEALSDVVPEALIHRLFWQEGLEVYTSQSYVFKCRCSREKVETVLESLTAEEEKEITKEGKITVTCDYCGEIYSFLPKKDV